MTLRDILLLFIVLCQVIKILGAVVCLIGVIRTSR